ncbi:hypothetical protein SAMN05216522_10293 [Rosenbergiella nectarea]|uniref:Type II toxin-antitoxin system RelE/ParE family toxin n=1 Tax=Rosenbergiella nectarea TaxID=988801 RepID=A0A1H9EZ96_9GAMM|nr:type II toxin-antitoxin system RelE/ParE family toxin [Rosenbergiella nectarea]SEQ30318.1 hypothetical protein SAMN05216522_10293 [Rosenbergiella nectarea]
MDWEVETRELFDDWLFTQEESVQVEFVAALTIVEKFGPQLSRPYADTINGSKHANMKELIVQINGHPFRAFYAFDPTRRAIVCCAGDKKGKDEKKFYKKMIKTADSEFDDHLASLED